MQYHVLLGIFLCLPVGKIVQTNTVQRERDISDELLEKMLENKESE